MAARWDELARELRSKLGDSVRFDTAHQAAYASDASNYRQVPIGVVLPRSIEQLAEGIAICARWSAPVLMRGGGTAQNGQSVNEAVVFDVSPFCDKILELDPAAGMATVEPGVVCDSLRNAAEAHGLTFAPDPSTHSRCTLGGMIANNACGAHSVMAGKTLENVEALEVLTCDGHRFWVGPTSEEELESIIAAGGRRGEIYASLKALRDRYGEQIRSRFPTIKRRVSGFNLDQLLPENGFNVARALVGTEGTCAITLRAQVRLVPSPAKRVILVLGFPDIYAAADAVPEYQRFEPIAIEGLDRAIIRGLQMRNLAAEEIALLPAGDAWVVLEFGADSMPQAIEMAERARAYFSARQQGPVPSAAVVGDPAEQRRIWSIRENGSSATQLSIDPSVPDPAVGWEDAAVDPHRLGDYLRAFQGLVDRFGYQTSLFGHFGDGCVHARITFDLRTVDGVARFREFAREAARLVVAFGGSLSGEHGDGQAKAEFLPIMYGEDLMEAMHAFKRAWDPNNLLNPGKVVHPYRVDQNLRAGPEYKVVKIASRLQFRSAEGQGFQRQLERCVGMGRCRSAKGGTMCPSFRATHEERFSTRGRARLLWEMLQGDVVRDGWQSEEVKEALDACLACKGCRSDCPTHTDMASYKAEFLSHYHETRRRPRQAWSMGRIGQWARIAAVAPGLMNLLMRAPGLDALGKLVAGVAPDRTLPRFAPAHERRGLRKRAAAGGRRPKVVMWLDTFSEHFHPEVAHAAMEVLRDAGYDTVLPRKGLCCGRPLYDFGYLDQACGHLLSILDSFGDALASEEEFHLVGLEPGCLSVFKDELLKFFPDDARAQKLARGTTLLGDFLLQRDYRPPAMAADVLVHSHCHQRSLFGTKGDMAMLERMGAKARLLDSGCCGMAGSFGFDSRHAELSRKVGELVLLPEVRRLPESSFVLTNGFSCREQIEQGTGRKAIHLAELLQMALSRRALRHAESVSSHPAAAAIGRSAAGTTKGAST